MRPFKVGVYLSPMFGFPLFMTTSFDAERAQSTCSTYGERLILASQPSPSHFWGFSSTYAYTRFHLEVPNSAR